jgi:WS/DGAT/MGAT family acyltransferase
MTSNFCALGIFGPDANGASLDAERVKALIAGRIDRIPSLRARLQYAPLGLDHPAFVDGPVDLDAHVVATTVPPPSGDRELAEAIAERMCTRLDRCRPLWQVHVIDGLAGGRVALGMLFHHASADALAAAMVIALLTDPDPAGRDDLPDRVGPVAPPAMRDVVLKTATRSATYPARALRAGARALPYVDQVPTMRALPGARAVAGAARRFERLAGRGNGNHGEYLHAPAMRFNGPLAAGRAIAFGHVDVDLVRALKAAHGVTFNDIVVAAVAGGLRRRLEATGGVPDEPLLAYVPTNVRATRRNGQMGNAISSYIAPLPTDRADPGDRVRAAHEGMADLKRRNGAAPPTLLEDANALFFPPVLGPLAGGALRLMGAGVLAPPVNLVLSNVPGPPATVYFDGAPMERVAPLSLVFDGAVLNVTVVSYGGRLEIGVVGDRELVSDAWELVDDIRTEIEELHGAL